MTQQKKPFGFKDLFDILLINTKVIVALILFVVVFAALFFGYYSILLIVFAVGFLIYSLVDAYRTHQRKKNGRDQA